MSRIDAVSNYDENCIAISTQLSQIPQVKIGSKRIYWSIRLQKKGSFRRQYYALTEQERLNALVRGGHDLK